MYAEERERRGFVAVLDELMELRKKYPDLEMFFREDHGGRFLQNW